MSAQGRYFLSTCPICSRTALEAETSSREMEFQCASCGAFEITAAARSVIRRLPFEGRGVWLAQARLQARGMPLVACANEPLPEAAAFPREQIS